MTCEICQAPVAPGEAREHRGRMLCEDCFITLATPKVRTMLSENDPGGFMLRLKTAFPAHPQRHH